MLIARVRSFFARHRAAHAAGVVTPALVAALIVLGQSNRLDDDRAAWGSARTVWVATTDLAPGDLASARPIVLPLAAHSSAALTDDPTGLTVLQRVATGEVITRLDVLSGDASDGGAALPDDPRTVAVPVDDQSLLVVPGDRVDVVAGGSTLAVGGVIVAVAPGAVTVAVDARAAPVVAAAAIDRVAALVGRPVSASPPR